LRTEKVKELILQTNLTLKEIAYNLHYSSVSHLSKQFKKVTGLSPSHFKKLKENRRITIQTSKKVNAVLEKCEGCIVRR
jgi:AraC family transcriptional regulator